MRLLWRKAIDEELNALEKLGSWLVVERPKDKKVLHSKFELHKKRKSDGSVEKYKARFVVCGNEDSDVSENNFAPVIEFTLVKLFLSIAL